MAVDTVAGAPVTVGSRRWVLFGGLALAVVVADQLSKAFVARAFPLGSQTEVVSDFVRIVPGANSGAIFGLFRDQALLFGLLSVIVLGLIVLFHARSAEGGLFISIALGLLLGGAIGNLIDRFRLGYVLDFVDVGAGRFRWYTFNLADAAISTAIVLLFVGAIFGERLLAARR